MRDLDQRNDVRPLLLQRRVHRMPHALMAVESPFGGYFNEGEVDTLATMADPFRAPLEAMAGAAALQQQTLFTQPVPEWFVEFAGHWHRQTAGQIGLTHKVASLPKMQLLTGDTIGPEATIETSTRGTCAVEVPRI